MARYWDEFVEGEKFTTKGRTISEGDLVGFACITGDFNPLHTDEEYCKQTIFGTRIAHGLLGLTYALGLTASLGLTEGTVMAFLGLKWDFKKPILIGDTIHAELEAKAKRPTKKSDRGIVTFAIKVCNQRGEVVQEGERSVLVARNSVSV